MKSIKQWDNWQCVFTMTAEAQGVSNVLDLRYIPAMAAEAQLFDAHQGGLELPPKKCLAITRKKLFATYLIK